GNTSSPRLVFWPPYDVLDQLQNDPKTAAMHTSMIEILKETLASSRPGPFDLKRFFEEMRDQHGPPGLEIAFRFIDTYYEQQHQSVFTESRRVEWADVAQLEHLFESEDLSTQYGHFLDQRFLDYLARNESSLDSMNWRKFEGLAAEYFARSGYRVALSKGRNDDNVDLRVWNPGSSGAPLLLVQCKRQKARVGKVVVKALYADLLHERAQSGLIVTSSSLSVGAERTCLARGYPIAQADRQSLNQWLTAMQSPGAGVFMGT
ncbi:MAG TPA: restriction endonuclease, partial [Thermoanaerobaculia bacterium]|nr:restriction endonuclease [Thermoanaerobaculia bacterium]